MARVDVSFGCLDLDEGGVLAAERLLDSGERARAARFRFARDRRRFIVRRARLRQVLSAFCGCEPGDLVFAANDYGKPRLVGQDFRFSASHSDECWVVAVGPSELGVDCERIDPAIAWRELARGLFAAGELAALEAQPAQAVARAFHECWVRKEAFVKALGLGLSHPLDSFEVSVMPDARLIAGGEGWTMLPLDLGADIAGALVVRDECAPVDLRLHWHDRRAPVLVGCEGA